MTVPMTKTMSGENGTIARVEKDVAVWVHTAKKHLRASEVNNVLEVSVGRAQGSEQRCHRLHLILGNVGAMQLNLSLGQLAYHGCFGREKCHERLASLVEPSCASNPVNVTVEETQSERDRNVNGGC
jgi:hypothetical protein